MVCDSCCHRRHHPQCTMNQHKVIMADVDKRATIPLLLTIAFGFLTWFPIPLGNFSPYVQPLFQFVALLCFLAVVYFVLESPMRYWIARWRHRGIQLVLSSEEETYPRSRDGASVHLRRHHIAVQSVALINNFATKVVEIHPLPSTLQERIPLTLRPPQLSTPRLDGIPLYEQRVEFVRYERVRDAGWTAQILSSEGGISIPIDDYQIILQTTGDLQSKRVIKKHRCRLYGFKCSHLRWA